MLKTIKTTKQLRLDELIKLAFNNELKNGIYNSNKKSFNSVRVIYDSNVIVDGGFSATDLLEVEVEEEITEDTKFELLVGVYIYDDVGSYNATTFYNRSIDDVKDSEALCIYALINEKLEIIWERDNHGSN